MVAGVVIPPDRITWSDWLTDQSTLVTDSSGTKSVKPAGGKTPVRTQTLRIGLPVVAWNSVLVTNARARLPGWGNATRTTRWSRLDWNWFASDWKTLLNAL